MATGAASAGQGVPLARSLTCEHHPAIDPIAAAWDRLVPRDLPHLRAGFLRAAERGGLIRTPDYLMLYQEGHPVAVAVTYTLLFDTAWGALPRRQAWVRWVRKVYPGYAYQPLRVCGSPVTNAECGIYFAAWLPPAARRSLCTRVALEVLRSGGMGPTYFFKEFRDEAIAEFASELERVGFFPVHPSPGTQVQIRWDTFDDYVNAMRAKYRNELKKDLKAGEGLEFALLDSFADVASQATPLYLNVVARAAVPLQVASEPFFAAVSEFEQAALLVARVRATGQLVGINLLLFGDTVMQDIYIGLDYAENQKHRVYFNLLHQALRCAIDRKCRLAYVGQTAYEFKARLGANSFPVTAYMKHRLGFVHKMLRANTERMFPKVAGIVHSPVFRAEGEKD
jgi:predicted N-acyltransferase